MKHTNPSGATLRQSLMPIFHVRFFTNMALWQAREMPSRIYGWFPFCTAMVVGEIPPVRKRWLKDGRHQDTICKPCLRLFCVQDMR